MLGFRLNGRYIYDVRKLRKTIKKNKSYELDTRKIRGRYQPKCL